MAIKECIHFKKYYFDQTSNILINPPYIIIRIYTLKGGLTYGKRSSNHRRKS